MGTHATPPEWGGASDETDDTSAKLGDALSGRLADVDIDSVEAVRGVRERR